VLVGERRRTELIARRQQVGLTHESLAEAIDVSVSSVSVWERGLHTPRGRTRRRLAAALEVSLIELDRLLDPDTQPELTTHEVAPWLSLYESLVATAGSLLQVERSLIPALLQTREYATAIEQYGPNELTAPQIEARVEGRLARQAVLHRRPDPLIYRCLLSTTAFTNLVGGPAVMAGQLDRLLSIAEKPTIEIRVLPTDGRDTYALGGFQLISRPQDREPFLAIVFTIERTNYIEGREVETYNTTVRYLDRIALPVDASHELISATRKSLRP
jgi:transcriptional regulator with XRE-family HTH domain